jgi:hypothetical protein
MKHIHAIFTQRDLLFRQTPLDEIDKGEVVADKKDMFDVGIVLLQHGSLVNQNQGFTRS